MEKITVEDLLRVMRNEQVVYISFFACGIHYCNSTDSGKLVKELKMNLSYDCLKAKVFDISSRDNEVLVSAEIVD